MSNHNHNLLGFDKIRDISIIVDTTRVESRSGLKSVSTSRNYQRITPLLQQILDIINTCIRSKEIGRTAFLSN
jgi:hypothetical protein